MNLINKAANFEDSLTESVRLKQTVNSDLSLSAQDMKQEALTSSDQFLSLKNKKDLIQKNLEASSVESRLVKLETKNERIEALSVESRLVKLETKTEKIEALSIESRLVKLETKTELTELRQEISNIKKETTEALLSLHSRVVKLETMNEITQSLQAKYETEITELRQEILKIRNETTEALSSLESRLVKVETKNEKTNKTFSTMAYSVVFYGTIQCILYLMDPTQFVHDFKANAKLFLGRSVQKD